MRTIMSSKFAAALLVVIVTTGNAVSTLGDEEDLENLGWSNFAEWPDVQGAGKTDDNNAIRPIDEELIPLLVQPKYQRVDELVDLDNIKHGPKKIVGGNSELKDIGQWQPQVQQLDGGDFSGDYGWSNEITNQQLSSEYPSEIDLDNLIWQLDDRYWGNEVEIPYLKKSPEHPPQYPGGLLWSYKAKKGFATRRR